VKAAIEELGRAADADLAAHLRDELWEVVRLYQEEKKRAGQLDFMARDLLHHDGARKQLQAAYQRIFIDEFQDTDPFQAEILLLLAAADPAERDWRKVTPSPGKLYVVGPVRRFCAVPTSATAGKVACPHGNHKRVAAPRQG
jgi:ATP-dependent exoDNAse (exonuclease V) beta subunit